MPPFEFICANSHHHYFEEGMFNNANTIFRTKFVDGVSTVTRTVPALKAQADNHGEKAGGGPVVCFAP